MGKEAAKKGDKVSSLDIHMVDIPTPTGPVTVPLPHSFKAELKEKLSKNVNIMGKPAAMRGSTGPNSPKHVALGLRFASEPSNECSVFLGSMTVNINGRPAARSGDLALTCNDPTDLPIGKLDASGSVKFG